MKCLSWVKTFFDVDRGSCDFGDEAKVWGVGEWRDCQGILTKLGLKLVKLGIFPKSRIFAREWMGWRLGRVRVWGILRTFSLSW